MVLLGTAGGKYSLSERLSARHLLPDPATSVRADVVHASCGTGKEVRGAPAVIRAMAALHCQREWLLVLMVLLPTQAGFLAQELEY